MDRFVVISGCSGGGKSTLLTELRQRGHATVDEPGRRIIQEEVRNAGQAVPWADMTAFLRRAIETSIADQADASSADGWVFFDRGLIDAVAALQAIASEPVVIDLGGSHRYHRRVFLTPPWPEVYEQDPERRHSMDAALTEYSRLLHTYPALGYEVLILPKIGVSERADFVLDALNN